MKDLIEHIVFYGTLCQTKVRKELNIDDSLIYISPCTLSGSLYDLGDYPGLILNTTQTITAELYKIKNMDCLNILDDYEDYHPDYISDSLYIRKIIHLPTLNCLAWIYEYNQKVIPEQLVINGIWDK